MKKLILVIFLVVIGAFYFHMFEIFVRAKFGASQTSIGIDLIIASYIFFFFCFLIIIIFAKKKIISTNAISMIFFLNLAIFMIFLALNLSGKIIDRSLL